MRKGCSPATAMVRYMRTWFWVSRLGTPSVASDRIFRRSERIWEKEDGKEKPTKKSQCRQVAKDPQKLRGGHPTHSP